MSSEERVRGEIERIQWFWNVGGRTTLSGTQARSWREAVEFCRRPKWENFTLTIMNRLRELAAENYGRVHPEPDWEEYWNDLERYSESADQFIEAVCQEGVYPALLDKAGRDIVTRYVRTHLVQILFEAFLQDRQVQPLFFIASLLPVYAAGHFPCGWKGGHLPASWRGNSAADLPQGEVRIW